MVFRHAVKYNGVIYLAGADVPMDKVEEKAEEPKKASALLDEEEVIPKKKAGRPPKNKE